MEWITPCNHPFIFLFLLPGYECEAHNNPPDFFLDVINGDTIVGRAIRDPDDGKFAIQKQNSQNLQWQQDANIIKM